MRSPSPLIVTARSVRLATAHVPQRPIAGVVLLPTSPVTADQVRQLTDLRQVVRKLGGTGVPREEVLARLRHHGEALTLMTRLRRSGMSEATIEAAMFDGVPTDT